MVKKKNFVRYKYKAGKGILPFLKRILLFLQFPAQTSGRRDSFFRARPAPTEPDPGLNNSINKKNGH